MPSNDLIRAVVALVAVIDPVGNLLIYHILTARLAVGQRAVVAVLSNVVAFLVLALFIVTGISVLDYLHISLPSFEIAAGLLLAPSAYRLVEHGQPFGPAPPSEQISPLQLAVAPLAIPLLAGPGALATAVSFTGAYGRGVVLLASALVLLLSAVLFLLGPRILALLGESFLRLFSRLIGILLMAIAVNLAVTGVVQALRA
jgi:multiple antibiotic resistance protein